MWYIVMAVIIAVSIALGAWAGTSIDKFIEKNKELEK